MDIVVDSEGNSYVTGYELYYDSYLSKWDSDGNQLWNITASLSMLDMGADDHLYAASRYNDGIIAVKMDFSGTQIWNTTWARLYHAARLYFTPPYGIAACPDGSVYVVAEGFLPHSVPLVVKFDGNGDYQWNTTWGIGHIGDGMWNFYGNSRNTVDVGENGLAYITGHISTETNGYVGLVVFGDNVPSPSFDFVTIGITGVGLVSVAVAIVIVYRKRKAKIGMT
jgi:outer membrane protein assembly factor BamB